MALSSPHFLLLVPALALLGWKLPALGLFRPLRALLLLGLILILCDPQIRTKSGQFDLWVLIDRSASADSLVAPHVAEWRTILEQSRPSQDHQLHFVEYAAEVSPSTSLSTSIFEGNRNRTNTSLAVKNTLASANPHQHHRILLFTDGYSTEPLSDIGRLLIENEVALDYRLLKPAESPDIRVTRLTLPEQTQVGEPFILEISMAGNLPGSVPLAIYRDGQELALRNITLQQGQASLRLSDRLATPGSHQYRVELRPDADAIPGNNHTESWIEVMGGPRVMLISAYESDPYEQVLKAQGFEVVTLKPSSELSPGVLTGAKALVINNVPAHMLSLDFLKAIPFFVREQGGGFLMAGGRHSFGSGGYFESPIDELLPVSMELKNEHRKLAVAMAIVMDRSGSMSMSVSGGNTKMELANEGAARAIELLGNHDAVSLFAVDTQAHRISPLLNVGQHRGDLISRARKIESMGGGIYVYTGMNEAWKELKQAEAGQRHMILFADASDAEDQGQYQTLLEEMRRENTTVSVIGLGTTSDPDAAFLIDVARRGEGRHFFTESASDVPNIFAQETVTVARSTFLDEPTATTSTGRWFELAQKDLAWATSIDGYNLSYLREGDQTALVSNDQYQAPLVAFGRRGIGKTAAVSFPLGGEYSELTRSWEHYGDFLQTLTRWLMGDEVPPEVGVRHQISGTELRLDLMYDDGSDWAERFSQEPPLTVMQRGLGNAHLEHPVWERLRPGHYSLTTQLSEKEVVRGAIQIAGSAIPFGPLVVGNETEWATPPERVEELRETSRVSGGSELIDLKSAWRRPQSSGMKSLRHQLLPWLLVLFLIEAFVTRAGWRLPAWSMKLNRRAPASQPPRRTARQSKGKAPLDQASSEESNSEEKIPQPTDTEKDRETRKRRYSQAKKRL